MNRLQTVCACFILGISTASLAQNASPDPKSVAVVDGESGPCSADFTITNEAGAPVYGAKISVHIAYGFVRARRLNLEVGTNADGKARFTGIPNKLKRGLTFTASKDDLEGTAFVDPAATCKAQLTITLRKKPTPKEF